MKYISFSNVLWNSQPCCCSFIGNFYPNPVEEIASQPVCFLLLVGIWWHTLWEQIWTTLWNARNSPMTMCSSSYTRFFGDWRYLHLPCLTLDSSSAGGGSSWWVSYAQRFIQVHSGAALTSLTSCRITCYYCSFPSYLFGALYW